MVNCSLNSDVIDRYTLWIIILIDWNVERLEMLFPSPALYFLLRLLHSLLLRELRLNVLFHNEATYFQYLTFFFFFFFLTQEKYNLLKFCYFLFFSSNGFKILMISVLTVANFPEILAATRIFSYLFESFFVWKMGGIVLNFLNNYFFTFILYSLYNILKFFVIC